MMQSNYQVRRATIDDLVVLRRFWQRAALPLAPLEKRLGEFQVVETADGEVLGIIGVRIAQQQAQIHTELYGKPELAADLRPRLWERVQSIARHHGLARLWIKNGTSAFWLEQGFEPAGSDLAANRPESFVDDPGEHWLSLQLRVESDAATTLNQELEIFRLTQKQQGDRVLQHARVLRAVAGLVAGIVLILIACAIWYVLQHGQGR